MTGGGTRIDTSAAGFTTLLTAALTALRATGCDRAEGLMKGAVDALNGHVNRAISLSKGPIS